MYRFSYVENVAAQPQVADRQQFLQLLRSEKEGTNPLLRYRMTGLSPVNIKKERNAYLRSSMSQ